MLDYENQMELKYDQDILYLMDEDLALGEDLDQEEEQPVDSLEPLVCGKDLFSDSQLVDLVISPTQDPMEPPAQDAETVRALQEDNFSWSKKLDQEVPFLEHCLEVEQEPGARSLLKP